METWRADLLHFVVPDGVLSVTLRLERRHFVLGLVPRLVRDVGDLNHIRNLLLLVLEVPLQLGVNLVTSGGKGSESVRSRRSRCRPRSGRYGRHGGCYRG
eukprot:184091-Prorocentrum_minimum.AAC.1